MERDIRHRRGSGGAGTFTTDPSVRSNVTQHTLPNVQSRYVGVQGLADAVNRFAMNAHGLFEDDHHRAEMRRIERENEAQAEQGVIDQTTGKPISRPLINDRDYTNAYHDSQAKADALRHHKRFNDAWKVVSRNDPNVDFLTFRDDFIRHAVDQNAEPRLVKNTILNFHRYTDGLYHQEAAKRGAEKDRNESKRYAAQGAVDAERGHDPTNENPFYLEAYYVAVGRLQGQDAAREFSQLYQEAVRADPTLDYATFEADYLAKNLTHFDDPMAEHSALSTFRDVTRQGQFNHDANVAQLMMQQSRAAITGDVIGTIELGGSLDGTTIMGWMSDARKLMPHNPAEAAPLIAASIRGGLARNPAMIGSVTNALSEPGTGINGASFADSFPEAFASLQLQALQDDAAITTREEQDAVEGFQTRLQGVADLEQADLDALAVDLFAFQVTGGARSAATEMISSLRAEYDRRIKRAVEVQTFTDMLAGRRALEPGQLQSSWSAGMKALYGTDNILELDPNLQVDLLGRLQGTVPAQVRGAINTSLRDGANPEGQSTTLQMLGRLARTHGNDYVQKFLDDENGRMFMSINETLKYTSTEPAELIRLHNENRNDPNRELISWNTMVGRSDHLETLEDLDRLVTASVLNAMGGELSGDDFDTLMKHDGSWLGRGVLRLRELGTQIQGLDGFNWFHPDAEMSISPNVMQGIKTQALEIIRDSGGTMDPSKALELALTRITSRLEVIPSYDNQLRVTFDEGRPTSYRENGQVRQRVRLGPSVTNPITREEVNTLSVFNEDTSALLRSGAARTLGIEHFLPLTGVAETFDWSNSTMIELSDHTDANAHGAFVVSIQGERFAWAEGETIDVGGQTITVPNHDDPDAMAALDLPNGYGVVPTTVNGGDEGWMLVYRPNFGDDAGMSVKERETEANANIQAGRTEVSATRKVASGLVTAAADAGLIPTRYSSNGGSYIDQRMDLVFENLSKGVETNIIANGPNAPYRGAPVSPGSYSERQRTFITGKEGERTKAYPDGGDVSVGYGFYMGNDNARELWERAGVQADFDAVRTGRAEITLEDADALYRVGIKQYEDVVAEAAGGVFLNENERIALTSIAYNSPVRVKNMAEALQAGDKGRVVEMILYESFNPKHNLRVGLARRRYQEALKFLSATGDTHPLLPDPAEYLDYWKIAGGSPNRPSPLG